MFHWCHHFPKQIEAHCNTVALWKQSGSDLPRANDFAVSLGTLQVAQRRDCEVEDRDGGIFQSKE